MIITKKLNGELKTYSEPDLVLQLKLQNRKAFNYFYTAYADSVSIAIQKIVKCKAATDEILQNTFLKFWLNINKYKSEKSSLYSWLILIARSESIDFTRSRYTKENKLTQPLDQYNCIQKSSLLNSIDNMDVLKSLKTLEPKDREIISLYIIGFTCNEVSKMMSMPVGTVKTRMRFSYKRLRYYFAV